MPGRGEGGAEDPHEGKTDPAALAREVAGWAVRNGIALRDAAWRLARRLQARCPGYDPFADWTAAEVFGRTSLFDSNAVVEALHGVWEAVRYPEGEGMARECGRAACEATFPVCGEGGRQWRMTPAQARVARLAFYLSLVNERHPFPFPVELVGELVGTDRWTASNIITALVRMKVIEVTDPTYKPPRGGHPGVARRVRFIGRVPRELRPAIPY